MTKASAPSLPWRLGKFYLPAAVDHALRTLGETLAQFWRNNGPGMAGMVAFFGFLSLVPLVILLLAFTGVILGGSVPPTEIERLFHSVVPGLSRQQFLHTYWDPVRRSTTATTVLGAASLLLGTLGLHDSVDWAVNRIWHSSQSRPFWVAKLRGLAVILWATGFGLFSLWLAWLWSLVLGAAHAPIGLTAAWLALVPTLTIDIAIFTALYKLTPTVDVDLLPAFVGGLVGSSLWEASKIGFGWWALQVASYNRVYGPLAASVIVMLWLWVSASVFLFGAQLSSVVQEQRKT